MGSPTIAASQARAHELPLMVQLMAATMRSIYLNLPEKPTERDHLMAGAMVEIAAAQVSWWLYQRFFVSIAATDLVETLGLHRPRVAKRSAARWRQLLLDLTNNKLKGKNAAHA